MATKELIMKTVSTATQTEGQRIATSIHMQWPLTERQIAFIIDEAITAAIKQAEAVKP